MIDVFSAKKCQSSGVRLDSTRTAVLIIDMLNDFCKSGGAMVLPGYTKLLGPQRSLISTARTAGSTIVFVNDAHRPQAKQDREFVIRAPHCIEGSWGAEVVGELEPNQQDLKVTKRRYSGFFNTDLDLTLKDNFIDTVIVAGVVTNICVRSTVHDAFFLGYRVIVPEDCVAATGLREQESSLYDIGTHFGIVSNSVEVAGALENGSPVSNRIS